MNHIIEHDLDKPTAKRVVDRAFDEYKKRFADYHPTLTWSTEDQADVGFNAKGIKLSGSMLVKEKAIELDLDVPFLLRPFKSKAIEVIDQEVRNWVEKAQKGELD